MAKVLDFSASVPDAGVIKAQGYQGAMFYCAPARESWMKGKQPTREVLDRFDKHGLKFGFVWQYRKGGSMAVGDAGRGHAGGYKDAAEALKYLNQVRCSGHPVFFAVDWNITLDEWNSQVVKYFRGACDKLGRERVGIYGHSRVIHWAMEDQVVGEVAPGRVLGWQTSSWSHGVKAEDYAVLYQHTHNVTGPGGVQVDINDVWFPEWGWRAIPDKRANIVSGFGLAPVEYKCDVVIDTPDSGWRDPAKTQATVFHTTENNDATPPENVANWQKNPANGSSYNILIGADATGARTIRTNPDNRRSWSAGEPGNTQAIHVSAIGWAKRSRADWLANPRQLQKFAEIAADHHLRYGRALKFVDRHGLRRGEKGFTSHGEWYHGKGGPAYRYDPGSGFPWDVVLGQAKRLVEATNEIKKETEIVAVQFDRVHEGALHEAKIAAQAAEKNTVKLVGLGEDPIPSIINPAYKFHPKHLIAIIDSTGWENRVLLGEICRKLGIDPEKTVADAIEADRAATKEG